MFRNILTGAVARSAALALCATAYAANLAVAAPAFADTVIFDDTGEVRSVSLSYSPQDLATDTGAKAMWRRIEQASRSVCGGAPDPQLLAEWREIEKCRREAQARAVNQLNAPLVTAMATHGGAVIVASR
jgi:UrcA family protein